MDYYTQEVPSPSSKPEFLRFCEVEEFRPFLRKLPELKFWNSCTICLFISIFCTFLSFLDVPVFWPILVMYFFLLFYVTMKRQISHMIKYRYLPFTYGKPRHQSNGMRF
uniref:Protein RER1-like protein n=1 Tax=Schistosoma haematobium TaxID=6185 RepID=A0A094ZQP4_SCHHA